MKSTPAFVGIVLVGVGAIFIVQGFGLAPTGSFMDGSPLWGWLGAGMALGGLTAVLLSLRRRR